MTFSGRLHKDPCGADPSAAGEEYRNTQSSTDNTNTGGGSLALDFTTDGSGNSTSSTTVPWLLPDNGDGESIVLTAEGTGDGSGDVAGCINLKQ